MKILLLSLERTRITTLRNAAKLVAEQTGREIFCENITEQQISSGMPNLSERVADADAIIISHILNEDVVAIIRESIKDKKKIILPFSSSGKLMRLVNVGSFSFGSVDKHDKEVKAKEVSLFRSILTKVFDEDDLVKRLKDLMELVPKVLKFIPGTAQGMRYYLESYLAWLEPTKENTESLVKILLNLSGYKTEYTTPTVTASEGIYYANTEYLFSTNDFLRAKSKQNTVGILCSRSSVVSGDTGYLDELIKKFELVGTQPVPVFTEAFDSRTAIKKYFVDTNGQPLIDAFISLTGFPLVGGHVRSMPDDAVELLQELDVPYFAPLTLTHQSESEWQQAKDGITPIQVATNISLTELDGAIEPLVLVHADPIRGKQLVSENADRFVTRILKRIALRSKPNSQKRLAIVIYCFPPARGAVGTAAYLDVSQSLYKLLLQLQDEGYSVDIPSSPKELLHSIIGEGQHYSSTSNPLNVAATLSPEKYKQLVPEWKNASKEWGEPPGELNTDGDSLLVQGKHFGNIFVGVQPGFGYEGDPMRLLFTKNAAPHHGFLAFYAYINKVWNADAVVHFGTHGALEFMPGKQNGLSADCYPHILMGDVPNIYLYSVNNPSEAAIAKRRSYATTVSYLVPTNERAGLYRELESLRQLLNDYELTSETNTVRREALLDIIKGKAAECRFEFSDTHTLSKQLIEIEERLIPLGLRIIAESPKPEELADTLFEMAKFERIELGLPSLLSIVGHEANCREMIVSFLANDPDVVKKYISSRSLRKQADDILGFFRKLVDRITTSDEITPLIRALEGKYILPGPGGDLLRVPQALPVGRNITSLNPLAMPSEVAIKIGKHTVSLLLERTIKEQGKYPESIGLVLWGLDNIKTGGEAVAQAFALLGIDVVPDSLGNMSRLKVVPLETLGRPRIDCVFTVSGIFRDMFGHQMNMLDEAVRLVAFLNEPADKNFIRKHYLEMTSNGADKDSALYRVFSNASGTYGTNVDYMVMSNNWEEQSDLADIFAKRKGFAFGKNRDEKKAAEVLKQLSGYIEVTYQNLDSSEIGISDVDHYYEYLGGLTNLAATTRGTKPTAYVTDTTTANAVVRTLEETVALEARTKVLNPKWYEAMMKHGYEGVEEIKKRVDYTYGWSATAQAAPTWFYDEVHETFIRNEELRERMQKENPDSFSGMVDRLFEANRRNFWNATDEQLKELSDVSDAVLDEMEGLTTND
jgi:magnesium chelatase subunit H